jgi:hypothetical protein
MSPRRHLSNLAAAAALVTWLSSTAVAGPWSLAPGEYATELRGSFFSSGSYYDDNGDRIMQDGLAESRALAWDTEMGWTKHTSVQFGLPAVSTTLRSNSPAYAATSTGFGDFSFGLRYSLHNAASAAAVQVLWEAPAGYNSKLTPGLGDGNQRLSAQLELGAPLGKRGFVQVGGGYLYDYRTVTGRSIDPMDGPGKTDWADHTLVHGALAFWMGRVQIAGLYTGQFAGATGRATKTTSQLAGPRFTCRVDQRLDAFAGSWHTPGGKNVLHVDQFYAGLGWKLTKLNRLQGFLGGDKRP